MARGGLKIVPWQRYSAGLSAAEEREFAPFLHELIGRAFSIIGPLFLTGTEVLVKSDATPVTAADRGTEAALRGLIEVRYPGHGIVGEEFGVREGQRYRWILDPIDGTKAFVSNCFLFGSLIALERDDGDGYRPVLGCIAHAAVGLALIGHRDRTTLFRRDGTRRRVVVRAPRSLAQATVLATSLPGAREPGSDPSVLRVLQRAALARTWGDCFGYFALATGGADAMLDPTLSYWDVAAIVPVVEGAGGRVSSWHGADPLRELSLIATSGTLHEEILALIRAESPGESPARSS
ncbi:Histidinol-phosphate phosphatase HisN [Burkholderiales bacterium]|nr:Histidinol-phosphate phosphatase HisN [Burkholderiales bacterium]